MAGRALLQLLSRAPPAARPPGLTATSARTLIPERCVCPAPLRKLHLSPVSFAGHNKWSKVKHIKGPKDEARARVFAKLVMMIRIAVKEGGPNPEMNQNLAQVLEKCRSSNMPKASVDAAIKSGDKSKAALQHLFEARGPGGCMLLIEVLTDNLSRSHQDMRILLTRNGGLLSEGARHNFQRCGVVVLPSHNTSSDRALELAIEAGAEDVQESEDEEERPLLKFMCDATEVNKVRGYLEKLGMEVSYAGLEFVPRNFSKLDKETLEAASSLIEHLNDSPEVVRVWDNIQAQS